MKRQPDPLLRLQPWKIAAVFDPIERILHRMELDGTVDAAGRQIVFREDSSGGWYDAVAWRSILASRAVNCRRRLWMRNEN